MNNDTNQMQKTPPSKHRKDTLKTLLCTNTHKNHIDPLNQPKNPPSTPKKIEKRTINNHLHQTFKNPPSMQGKVTIQPLFYINPNNHPDTHLVPRIPTGKSPNRPEATQKVKEKTN